VDLRDEEVTGGWTTLHHEELHNLNASPDIRGPICKVRGLTLLLRVGTLWRCGHGLFFEVPPLASEAILTTLHPLLENGVTVILKEPYLGWRSNLNGASALHD
jgi:hypothetical protein